MTTKWASDRTQLIGQMYYDEPTWIDVMRRLRDTQETPVFVTMFLAPTASSGIGVSAPSQTGGLFTKRIRKYFDLSYEEAE